MRLDRHLLITRHDLQLLDHGQALLPEDLSQTCLEPMPALETKLFADQRLDGMLIQLLVMAITEKLLPHRCTRALQGSANIGHAYILAPISK
jgi:hypothetical protein